MEPVVVSRWHRYGWIPGVGLALIGNLWVMALQFHSLQIVGLLIVIISVPVFWAWLYERRIQR